jgi:hypothetical protein
MDKIIQWTKWNRRIILECAIIFLVGMAPLLWFQGSLIHTEDLNLPKNFETLKRYFYAWDDSVNLGFVPYDYFQAIFFFSFQSLISLVTTSLQSSQQILFLCWFLILGLSFYYFLHAVLPKEVCRYGALTGAIFYMTNIALFPIWVGFNVANLTGYAFGPLMLAIYLRVLDNRMSFLKGAMIWTILSVGAGGIGVNIPFSIVFSIPFFGYVLFKLIYRSQVPRARSRLLCKAFVFLSLFGLVNAYWILPTISSTIGVNSQDVAPFSQQLAFDWLKGISHRSSLLNVIRLQGEWTFGAGWGGDLYDPHSTYYLQNPVFIALSLLLSALAFSAPFLAYKNRKVLFFSIIAIISIFGGAGGHSPTGSLYMALVKHVPFLWLIRSPWYKFSFLTALSYSFLISVSVGVFVSRLQADKYKIFSWQWLSKNGHCIVIGLILLYSSPLLLGKMFTSPGDRLRLPTSRIELPEYVMEMADYINENIGNARILVFPPFVQNAAHANSWDFYGFRSVLYEVSLASLVENRPKNEFLDILYEAARHKDHQVFKKMLELARIRYVLYERDAVNKLSLININHESYESFLSSIEGFKLVKRAGQWALYKIPKKTGEVSSLISIR